MTSLATLDNIKSYLAIANEADDDLLTRLLAAATALIVQFIDRDPISQVYSRVYDGSGTARQVLSYYPVTAVSAVSINDVAQSAAANTTATGYRFDKFSVFLNYGSFTRGTQNIAVTYTAGYTTIPADLVQACIDIAAEAYRRRNRVGETTKAIGQGNTSFSLKDIPDHVRIVLLQYQKQSPI